jgi:hypothetical protein
VNAGVTELVLAAVISGGVVSVLLGFGLRLLFERHLGRATEEIKNEFAERALLYRSSREWREASVRELLGPVYMQLDRSGRAFERWKARNFYIETTVMKEGNTTVRDLLLQKGYLIPPPLLEHAGKLVEHYDRWLEEYENVRGGEHPDPHAPFVFVGPKGFPFPVEAERAFRTTFKRMWTDLYEPQLERGAEERERGA